MKDSIAINEEGDRCVITCMCGDPTHGALIMDRRVVFIDDFSSIFYVDFAAVPTYGSRLRHAWRVLTNRPIRTQLKISKADSEKLGKWLLE